MNKIPFESEYILHKLTQKHLKELFGLEFVASEIQLNKLRLDNLAFDRKTNTFVIIEYKNKFDSDVLNQAQNYYDLILENKKFFCKRLENTKNIDFENTKILIIGPKFSKNQVKDAKTHFELWKITLFDECKVTYENLKTKEVKSLDINPKDLKITQAMLLENRSEEIMESYFKLKNRVLGEFSDVDIKYLVEDFSFKVNGNLICVIRFLKSSFNVYIYGKNLKNAEKTEDISTKSTGGNANYLLKYKSDEDLDYFMNLFKQVYTQKR